MSVALARVPGMSMPGGYKTNTYHRLPNSPPLTPRSPSDPRLAGACNSLVAEFLGQRKVYLSVMVIKLLSLSLSLHVYNMCIYIYLFIFTHTQTSS